MKKLTMWAMVLVLLCFVLTGIFLTAAPEEIPMHYNIQGEIDRWGSKYEMLIMPVICLVSGVFLDLVARHEGKKGREMNCRIVGILNAMMLAVFNVIWIAAMLRALEPGAVSSGLAKVFERLMLMSIPALMVLMGNLMPKAGRNSVFGLRTKWSMANDHCWQRSQRVGGWLMVGGGFLGVILTAVLPVMWAGIATVAMLVGIAAASVWASYRIYMRSQIQ